VIDLNPHGVGILPAAAIALAFAIGVQRRNEDRRLATAHS
jgi:hypothetical protein